MTQETGLVHDPEWLFLYPPCNMVTYTLLYFAFFKLILRGCDKLMTGIQVGLSARNLLIRLLQGMIRCS